MLKSAAQTPMLPESADTRSLIVPKLNQILAVEKGVKSRNYNDITDLDRQLQQPALLTGITRVYQPREDGPDAEQLPPEGKFVQVLATEALDEIAQKMAQMFDVTATKEWANTAARADIIVDGETILPDVPVTYLLFLEKQLTDVATLCRRLPVLDPANKWEWDPAKGCYVTEPVTTYRTKKVPRVVVKYDATPEHPAQTELFHEDEIAGTWLTTHMSGALPVDRAVEMAERAKKLLDAVKVAREAANDTQAPNQTVGEQILDYVFAL